MTSITPKTRLRLLGGATLEGEQGPVSGRGAQRRRIALLAVLAGIRRPVSRDKIVGLLWEEADSEKARKLLSESIYVIRKAVADDVLIASGDDLRLNPDVIWCDVVEFQAAIERSDYAAAVSVYGGAFLDGFFISDAPEFEKWVDGVRDTLARTHADALCRLATAADTAGRTDEAVQWWRKLTEQDPFNATHALGLMRALDRTGQRAAALQHARTHASMLRAEFDADPDAAVEALARQLKDAPPAVATAASAAVVRDVPVAPAAVASAPIAPATVAPAVQSSAPTPASPPPSPPTPANERRSTTRYIIAAAAAVIVIAGLLFAIRRNRAPVATDTVDRVAVFPFAAIGSDAEWSAWMADQLTLTLDGAGNVETADVNAIAAEVGPDPGIIAPATASAITRRAGAQFYVIGSVKQAGNAAEIIAKMYSVAGDTIVSQADIRGSVDSMFTLVDQLTFKLLEARGVGLDDLTSLANKTTPILAAWKDYLTGDIEYRAGRYGSAVTWFRKAIAKDPKFALAYYRLSAAAEWSFAFDAAPRAAAAAQENSERLPPRYQPMVRAWSYFLEGKADDAEREYRKILDEYPNDIEAISCLGEVLIHFNPSRGRSRGEARTMFERVLTIAPAYGEVRFHMMESLAVPGTNPAPFDSLLSVMRPKDPQYLAWVAVRAYTWGTRADQDAALASLRTADALEIGIAVGRLAAHTHNYKGALEVARELIARTHDDVVWQASGHLMNAELYIASGDPAAAQREFASAMPIEPDWTIELQSLAMLHPLANPSADDLRRQQKVLIDWDPSSRSPNTKFFFRAHALHHPRLRFYLLGLISVRLNDLKGAEAYRRKIETLPVEKAYEDFRDGLSKSLKGHIELARGDHSAALRELTGTSIDATPEVIAVSPFFSRAHDRFVIARIYEQMGNKSEARKWYSSLIEGYDFMYASAAQARLDALGK